ncbi:hypothetical protein AWR36_003470 [Microbulbifer flavimaris]|uniref:DUF7931 domain-containing protein n=1 Tax=Microbulbifer flavimaris TaxID=1781068 RepID=A0ABX4I3Y1_9GAMM|nr:MULTISPECIES: hypothetical protein [Microbulbifer]KUJ84722.1 hypothetical protein AVO43_03475 [Microbulbifer sp. ZGT114]PCO06816.1 hypothetical protein AWR36_003470 [Microbulbifer flavimaris]
MTDTGTDTDGVGLTEMERIRLADVEAFERALIDLCHRARREICLFSHHLDRDLYHREPVVEALSEFARRSRYARVRILIRDSDPMLQRHHRLLTLIQRLTSRIELKKLQPTVDTPDSEFAIADDGISLLREDREQWIGVYCPDDRVRTKRLREAFEQDWPLAVRDASLRQLVV